MTCHPQGLNFKQFIEQGQIVLINLHGEAIRSEVSSLGAIFLGGLFLASETLPYLKDGQPARIYLYVDEIERFVTTPLPDMFSQARKFGLSLTLANQFMGQLSEATRDGLLGNAGTFLVFEVGPDDAKKLRPVLGKDIEEDALLSLGKYRAVVKTRAHGDSQVGFVVATRNAPAGNTTYPGDNNHPHAMPKAELKAWLDRRYRAPAPSAGEGGAAQPENAKPASSTEKGSEAKAPDALSDYE